MNIKLRLFTIFLGSGFLLKAQDSLQTRELDAVIVTGQFEPQSVKKSVYQARVIPMERILQKGAVRVQDVLNTELNIRFSQDLALGGSNLSLQGLAGQNVKVLIDGAPMVGRQGTSNEININQINVQSIERIEIIEGPMSVVYGADALAGIINIITKKSIDGKLHLSARVHEETVGEEYGWEEGIHNESLSSGYSKNGFHIRTDLSRNYFGGWQGNAQGRDKQWHPKTQYMAGLLGGYDWDESNLYYRTDYLFENIYNPEPFQAGEALEQNYYTNRLMQQLQGGHKLSGRLHVNGVFSYTTYQRETQTTTLKESNGERRLALGAGLQETTKFNGLTFRGTAQYKLSEKLSFQPGVDISSESGSGGRIKEGTQSIGDYAFFVSGEWSLNKQIQVRPGLRVMHNTVYEAPPVIPSINAKIKLSPRYDLRLAYGMGFRAPSLRELYFNFFDANHSIEGNTELEAELSNSFNLSLSSSLWESSKGKLTSVIGVFYNSVENMIGYGQKPGSTLVTTYINIDHYQTAGFTWNNGWKNKSFDINVGGGLTGRYNQLNENFNDTDEFNWSPELTSTINYRFQPIGLSTSLYYKLTGKTPYYELITEGASTTAHLVETEAFQWADLSFTKSLGKNLNLTLGVHNLLNVKSINSTSLAGGTHTGGSSRAIGNGRSYFISVNYSLNK